MSPIDARIDEIHRISENFTYMSQMTFIVHDLYAQSMIFFRDVPNSQAFLEHLPCAKSTLTLSNGVFISCILMNVDGPPVFEILPHINGKDLDWPTFIQRGSIDRIERNLSDFAELDTHFFSFLMNFNIGKYSECLEYLNSDKIVSANGVMSSFFDSIFKSGTFDSPTMEETEFLLLAVNKNFISSDLYEKVEALLKESKYDELVYRLFREKKLVIGSFDASFSVEVQEKNRNLCSVFERDELNHITLNGSEKRRPKI